MINIKLLVLDNNTWNLKPFNCVQNKQTLACLKIVSIQNIRLQII